MRTSRKLLPLVCALIFTILPANAQHRCYDALVYDLAGHVKEAQVTYSDNEHAIYYFDLEGRFVNENGEFMEVERNEEGYAIKVNGSSPYGIELTYNSFHRIRTQKFMGFTIIYEYDKNHNLIKTYREDKPEDGWFYVYTRFDDHINWIERKKYDLKTKKYKDTCYRKITYWSDDPFW